MTSKTEERPRVGPWADFEDAAAPHVAVLPDGTQVALPAGTILRKATANEIEAEKLLDVARINLDAGRFDLVSGALDRAARILGEKDTRVVGLRTMLHFLKPTAEEAAEESALTQAQALLRRARLFLGGLPSQGNEAPTKAGRAFVDEIDAFLAGAPVTSKELPPRMWTEE